MQEGLAQRSTNCKMLFLSEKIIIIVKKKKRRLKWRGGLWREGVKRIPWRMITIYSGAYLIMRHVDAECYRAHQVIIGRSILSAIDRLILIQRYMFSVFILFFVPNPFDSW